MGKPEHIIGGSIELAAEHSEKGHDVGGGNVGGTKTEVEAQRIVLRADAQGGDDRYLAMASAALVEYGRLSGRSPTASYRRGHQKTALVQKGQPGPQARGRPCANVRCMLCPLPRRDLISSTARPGSGII